MWHGGDPDWAHLEVIYPLEQACGCGARFALPPPQLPGQLAFDDTGAPDPTESAPPPGRPSNRQHNNDKENPCPAK